MKKTLSAVLTFLLLASPFLSAGEDAVLVTVTGERFTGDVVLSDGVFTVSGPDGEKKIEAEWVEKVRLNPLVKAPDAPPDCVLFLMSGGVLEGFLLEGAGDGESIPLSLPGFGALAVPARRTAGVFFPGKAFGRAVVKEAAEKVEKTRAPMSDRIVLQDGDVLRGLVVSLSKDGLVAEIEGKRTTLPLSRLSLVAFARLSGLPERITDWHAMLTTVYGSVVPVVPERIGKGTLKGRFCFGGAFEAPLETAREMEFLNGAALHLSDAPPSRVKEEPYYGVTRRYRVNRSVDGNPLTVAGRRFERGFGVHSYCRLEFETGGRYSLFIASAGIDDETGGRGSVVFRVLGDGRELYSSGLVKAGRLVKIRVKVEGVSVLALVVDYGGDDDLGDHADWCDPKLIRSEPK